MRGNGAVIGGSARKNFRCQFASQFECRIAVGGNLFRDFRVIQRINDHRDTVVIFCRAAEHGRPADVNVLDRVVQRHVRSGDGLLERIKIHNDEINRLNVMRADSGFVRFVAANEKQTAVDFRMERFDAAIEHFGKAGVFADVFYHEPGLAQRFGSATGGNNFNSGFCQNLRERNQARFVRN